MCSSQIEGAEAGMAAIGAGLDILAGTDLDGLEPRRLLALYRALEGCRRRLDAVASRALDEIDRTEAYTEDGHRRPHGFVRAVTRCGGGEAASRVKVARALRRLPELASAAADGAVPAEHLRILAGVVANPRITSWVEGSDDWFAEHARVDTAPVFASVLRQWERLADNDGAAPGNTERRDFSIRQTFDGWFRVTGTLPPLAGAQAAAVLARFEDDEYHADWNTAVVDLGDDTTPNDLPRTAAQRRADAATAIFARAVSAPPGEGAVPVVNIVVDHHTLADGAADLFGAARPPRDPTDADTMVCRTLDGHDLPPADAALAAFTGLVRRALIDGPGTVIDLGRRRRLYTGSARDAVIVQAAIETNHGPTCRWPGCAVSLPRPVFRTC